MRVATKLKGSSEVHPQFESNKVIFIKRKLIRLIVNQLKHFPSMIYIFNNHLGLY